MTVQDRVTRIDISEPARDASILFKAGDAMLLFSLVAAAMVGGGLVYDSAEFRPHNLAERVVQVAIPVALLGYAPLLAISGYRRRYFQGHAWLAGLMTLGLLGGIVAVLVEGWVWSWAGLIALAIFLAIWLAFAAAPAGLWVMAYDLLSHRVEAFDKRLMDIIDPSPGADAAQISAAEANATGIGVTDPVWRKPAPRIPVLGRLVVGIGMTGIAAFIVAFVTYAMTEKHDRAIADIAADAFGALVYGLPVSALLIGLGRRLAQPDASRLLEADERAPILLLRSFEDDPQQIPAKGFATRFLSLGFRGRKRLEAAIAGELARLGPFIAIGKPGERLPQLGAARAYFSDDEWQAAVRDWIERARLIVMIAGRTPWVRWELGEIARAGRLPQLLLLMPPGDAADRQNRLEHIVDSLEGTGYYPWLYGIDASKTLAFRFTSGTVPALPLLEGERDWAQARVRLIDSEEASEVAYELAIKLATARWPVGQSTPERDQEAGKQ